VRSKEAVLKLFEEYKQNNSTAMEKQWAEAKMARKLFHGDFQDHPLIKTTVVSSPNGDTLKQTQKTVAEVNTIRPVVTAISGTLVKNRRDAFYWALVEKPDEGKIDKLNSFKQSIRQMARADKVETAQDLDMLVGGYGAVVPEIDYNKNPFGQIVFAKLDPDRVAWDMAAREPNLTDARFAYFWKKYSEEEAEAVFGITEPSVELDTGNESESSQTMNDNTRFREDVYKDIEESPDDKLFNVYYFNWYDYETKTIISNPFSAVVNATPEFIAIAKQQQTDLQKLMGDDVPDINAREWCVDKKFVEPIKLIGQSMGVTVEVGEKTAVKTYYNAVLSNKKVYKLYKSIYQDGLSILFKTCHFNDVDNFWYGLPKVVEVPALLLAKAITEAMRVMGRNGSKHYVFEKSAFDASVKQSLTEKIGVVTVPDGALSGGKTAQWATDIQATGYEQLMQFFLEMVSRISGVSIAYMGDASDKNETGILNQRRVKQTLVSLSNIIDNVAQYQEENSRMLLPLMRTLIKDNSDSVRFFSTDGGNRQNNTITQYDLYDKYAVMIDEALTTDETRQNAYESFTEIGGILLQQGQIDLARPFLLKAVEMMPLGIKDKSSLQEALSEPVIDPAYVKQLEGQVQQLQGQVTQATSIAYQAQAKRDSASADKYTADAALTQVKAAEIIAKTDLTNAQVAKVITDLDTGTEQQDNS
jgi:hypothetical protein